MAEKSVPAAYAQLQKLLGEVEGIRGKPEFPAEDSNAYPYLEMGPLSGNWENLVFSRAANGEHKLPFKIHVPRDEGDGLPGAVKKLLPFPERVVNKLIYGSENLNGTVNGIVGLTYKQSPDKVGKLDTVAFEFELSVKIYGGRSDV